MSTIVVLSSQWFGESGSRRTCRLGRNAHRRLHLCTSFVGSSCIEPQNREIRAVDDIPSSKKKAPVMPQASAPTAASGTPWAMPAML